ncbi:MAG TPA: ABC transporter ATP-binding protein [Syntrophomonas sp.]|jgi:iron complex transport system ATP-binding protein|nr:ABC transporter ATP-binding protein [Syntrophomonas sp.]
MILSVRGIRFSYPGHPVLSDIGFSVERGECLAVLGTNGTGKSTLLKCLNRILTPQAGTVWIGPDSINRLGRNELAQKIGYVEQKREGSRCTVFDAVLLGRKPYIRWDVTKKDLEITDQAIAALGLSGFAMRYLDELSGGELQKVVIARALGQEPELLLMDEPTSNLDLKNQLEVLQIIRGVTEERGISAVVTMHDLNLALRFADKFLFLKDGFVFAAGGPEVVTPATIENVYSVPVIIQNYGSQSVVIPL